MRLKPRESRFVDYVLSFYGPGGIYTKSDDPFQRPMTRDEAQRAAIILGAQKPFDGDSIDRENARDLVLSWRLRASLHP